MTKGLDKNAKPLDLNGGPRRARTFDPLIKRYIRGPPTLYRILPNLAIFFPKWAFQARTFSRFYPPLASLYYTKTIQPHGLNGLGAFVCMRGVNFTYKSTLLERSVNYLLLAVTAKDCICELCEVEHSLGTISTSLGNR